MTLLLCRGLPYYKKKDGMSMKDIHTSYMEGLKDNNVIELRTEKRST